MEHVPMRTKTKATAVGFCSACGIVREDVEGVPVTDCTCTAKINHEDNCFYVMTVSQPIAVVWCEKHGRDACEECDCDCGGRKAA